jgi:hypothetical protein
MLSMSSGVDGCRSFVESGFSEPRDPFAETYGGIILGRKAFIKKTLSLLGNAHRQEISHRRLLHKSSDLHDILSFLSRHYHITRDAILTTAPYRNYALYLVKKHTPLTNPEIGAAFGGITYSAVTKTMERFAARMSEDHLERKALGLAAGDGHISTDTLIIMNRAPDEKKLNLLRLQYSHILIDKNGRYFNLDGTPSGIVYESDIPAWARELLRRINYTFSLQTQLSERPDVLEKSDYLPFRMKGKGSLIRTSDPVAKMDDLFRSNGWKANDRYVADGHGSSSFVYEKEEHNCRILFDIDGVGTVPRNYGFEIHCWEGEGK